MKPHHVYLASVLVWAAMCVTHYVLRTQALLAGPRDGDLYAYSWGFQAVVFLLFIFPLWFIGISAVIAAELHYFSHSKRDKNQP